MDWNTGGNQVCLILSQGLELIIRTFHEPFVIQLGGSIALAGSARFAR
jgi:hypothetical protein